MPIRLITTTLLFSLSLLSLTTAAQNLSGGSKPKIIVSGLRLSQFSANVYSVAELAFVNDSAGLTNDNVSRVIRTYSDEVVKAMTNYADDRFGFVALDSNTVSRLHSRSRYAEWENVFKEKYTSLVSDSVLDGQMRGTMAGYGADFLVSLNFYEITANYYPMYVTPYLKTVHRIDYEVFDRSLAVVAAGRVSLASPDIRASAMGPEYARLAREIADRLEIALTSPDLPTARQKLRVLREKRLANAWAAGISLGWGAPYGWAGAELVRNLGRKFDVGGGIGFGPSGFKAGAGVRAYLLNYGQKFTPFLGAHVAWASGLKFDVGGSEDESGNQTDPDDISNFNIPAGAALHLKSGFRWLSLRQAFLLGVGYGVPFGRYRAIVTGRQTTARQRTADSFAVGGFEAGFTYLYYLGRNL